MKTFSRSIGAVALTVLLLGGGQVLAMGSGFGDDPAAKYKEAVEAVEAKKYDEAVQGLEAVLEDDSRNADALNYMGFSYRKLGRYELALNYYTRALKVNPDHKGANEYIGEAYLELNQPEKAKTHLDRLAKLCDSSCEEYAGLKKVWDAWQAKQKPS